VEEKFRVHAAREVFDVWTGISADRSHISATLLKMVVFLKRLGVNGLMKT